MFDEVDYDGDELGIELGSIADVDDELVDAGLLGPDDLFDD
jgi:hypothetical protein